MSGEISALIKGFPMFLAIIGLIFSFLGFHYKVFPVIFIGLGIIGLSVVIWSYAYEKEHELRSKKS